MRVCPCFSPCISHPQCISFAIHTKVKCPSRYERWGRITIRGGRGIGWRVWCIEVSSVSVSRSVESSVCLRLAQGCQVI